MFLSKFLFSVMYFFSPFAVLTEVTSSNVYVLGGFVDPSVVKVSHCGCRRCGHAQMGIKQLASAHVRHVDMLHACTVHVIHMCDVGLPSLSFTSLQVGRGERVGRRERVGAIDWLLCRQLLGLNWKLCIPYFLD